MLQQSDQHVQDVLSMVSGGTGNLPTGAGSMQALMSAIAAHDQQAVGQGDNTNPANSNNQTEVTAKPNILDETQGSSTDQTSTQFKPNNSGQDNQWADPSLASPLAQLTRYLSGMDYKVGTDTGGAEGGASGADSLFSNSQFATTDKYDPNQTGMRDKALNEALTTAQKYDPGAHLEYYDPLSGTENGGSQPMVRVVMDQSKLPPVPKNSTLLSNLQTANNQTPDAGQGPHLYDQSAVTMDSEWGPLTSRQNINDNYDENPYTNVGFWGPLAVGALAGGAGIAGGFGGMSSAAAQGIVSGTTGTGLAAGSSVGLGTIQGGLGIARQIGDGQDASGSILNMLAGLTGVPGASQIASLVYNAARGGGAPSAASILSLLTALGRGFGRGSP